MPSSRPALSALVCQIRLVSPHLARLNDSCVSALNAIRRWVSSFTGRHAVEHRAEALGLHLSNDEVCNLTRALKERAELGSLNQEEVNAFIHAWYQEKGSLTWNNSVQTTCTG